MELNHETINSAPRDASTLILLRSCASLSAKESDFEVLLLKRHSQSNVLANAHVFAGGKFEDSDALWAGENFTPQELTQMQVLLGEDQTTPSQAGGLFMCALREAYEECGVLMGHVPKGQAQHLQGQALQAHVNEQLQTHGLLSAALTQLGVRLLWLDLMPWSRWITPKTPTVMNKRFDARFFIGLLPEGQLARHDDHETTQSVWFTPQQAMRAYVDKEVDLAAPQIMTLLDLSRFKSISEVFAHAKTRPPPLIEPHAVKNEHERMVCFPGDELHPLQSNLLWGPTRLYFKEGCFQPSEGLADILKIIDVH